jgi:hypothetical protein
VLSCCERGRSGRGSDTVQNLWDTVRGAAQSTAGDVPMHAGAGHVLGPVGNLLVGFGKQAWGAAPANQAAARATARGLDMITPTNPLVHPETGEQINPLTGAPMSPPGGPQP